MIEKLRIRNYRSINSQEFNSIGNMMILIGENNSGKSTVLSAIKTFNNYQEISKNDIRHGEEFFEIAIVKNIEHVSRRFSELLPTDKILEQEFEAFYFRNVNRRGGVESDVYQQEIKRFIRRKYFDDKPVNKIGIKFICKFDQKDVPVVEYTLTNYNFLEKYTENLSEKDLIVRSFKNILANIDDERKFFEEADGSANSVSSSVFNMFLDTLDSQVYENNIDEIKKKPAGELNIHELNSLFGSKMKDSSGDFLYVMRKKFKDNYNNEYEIEWDFDEQLKSRIRFETKFVDNRGNQIDFMSTGSGTRSIYLISLLDTYINKVNQTTRQNGIFLIEEPELYLYPKLESRMGEILKEISTTNQVFLTSHSSNLINYLPSEFIYLVEKERRYKTSEETVSKYSKVEDMATISEKLGFNAYPLLGKEFLILVEGKSDVKFYREFIKKHFPDYLERTVIMHVGGVENVKVGVTTQFIMNSEFKDKTFIIIDSDGRSDESIRNKYYIMLKEKYNYIKNEDKFYKRFYYTENATCQETLSFHPEIVIKEDYHETFYENVESFMDEYKDDLKSSIEHKKRKNVLEENDEIEIMQILNGPKSIEEKFYTLRSRVLSKKLLNKFKNEVFEFKSLNNYDVEIQKEMAPELFSKLNNFFTDNS